MDVKLEEQLVESIQESVIRWGAENFANFPWRSTTNRWHALAAEIMLQRTNAEQVVPVYEAFTEKYPSPKDYAEDNTSDVFAHLGLHWRDKWLKKLAEQLSEQPIPTTKNGLKQLPGIGDYISSAFLSMHLGVRATIIDSNVVRFYSRVIGFDADPETRRKKWFKELAEKLTPHNRVKEYNYGLIDFTREICKPKPLCELCPLKYDCFYFHQVEGE
ncbi:MAG: hypothetical protein L0154_07015 [Chloroflexi bacterium]|nr:hypothetical protein [Chloroflexota bacterium]